MDEKDKIETSHPSFFAFRSSKATDMFRCQSPYEAVPHIKREILHLIYNIAQ